MSSLRRISVSRGAAGAASRLARRGFVILLVAGAAISGTARPGGAQIALDRVEIVLDRSQPGRLGGSFTIANRGRLPLQVSLNAADWDRDSTGNNRFYPPGTRPGSCSAAVTVEPTSVRIDSGGTQEVRVALDRASLPTGECWTIVFATTDLPMPPARGMSGRLIVRAGVKIYVVPGDASGAIEVTGMRVRPHERPTVAGGDGDEAHAPRAANARASSPGALPAALMALRAAHDPREPGRGSGATVPVAPAGTDGGAPLLVSSDTAAQELQLVFRNPGTRHVKATGSLELRRADNSAVGRMAIPNLYLLPGSTVFVTLPLPDLPRGRYVAIAIFDAGVGDPVAGQVEFEVP